MVDLSRLSDEELEAIASGDMQSLSDKTLAYLAGESDTESDDYQFSALNTVKNIPSSAANIAVGMWDAVTSPVDTAKALTGVATGGLYNANRWLDENTPDALDFMGKPLLAGESGKMLGEDTSQNASAVADFYVNRYGGKDNILKTIENDPVGAMFDAAGAISLLGSAAKMVGAGNAANALNKTSAAINPINATANAAKYAGSKLIPKSGPASLYESAAKFGTTLDNRDALIKRALTEKIMPTERGVRNLQSSITDAQRQILGLIDDATQSGAAVPKGVVLRGIKQLKDSYRETPGGAKAIEQIDDIAKQMFSDDLAKKQTLSPSDLQKWKVKAYDKINYNAKRNVDAPVKEEVLKTTARAAKNEIENIIPDADIKSMNARQGELLELQAPLQRSANRIANRNLVSIDTPLKMSAGGYLGQLLGDPITGAAVGTAASILGNPKVKAGMAIQLERLKKTGDIGTFVRNNPGLSQAEIAAYVSQAVNSASQQDDQAPIQAPMLGR